MKLKLLLLSSLMILVLCGCGSSKNVNYLIDADKLPQDVLNSATRASDPVIMPGDMLNIVVSSFNEDATKPFNRATYLKDIGSSAGNSSNNTGTNNIYQYLVDVNGNIEFPVLGTLHVGGMTKSAIRDLIIKQIYPKYLTEAPSVEVRLTNFHITVLGAVGSPGIKTAPNERLTILEAVALAGDLDIKGMRTNVMIVRTNQNGVRSVARVDLTDPNLLASPNYYLQQNDVVYVQPNGSLARSSWSVPPGFSFGVGLMGTLFSIVTFVMTLLKK